MGERIIIYGHNDEEFQSQEDLIDFLSLSLFERNGGRYRYSQCKDADIIVVSRGGLAYGHLIVAEKIIATEEDIENFDQARCTYIVTSSAVYQRPVRLYADLGIKVVSFGKTITREQFDEIKTKAGGFKRYPSDD